MPTDDARDDKTITCYTTGTAPTIRPAPGDRDWMDQTPQKFAYRCLPLTIANQHGWEILNPVGFSAMWDGGANRESIIITPDADGCLATSHFGAGVLTLHIHGLFRTPPNVDLYLQGPVNRPKDGIYPLTGVVETDWSPMSFTYNWKFTRPRSIIRFDRGEPICSFFPIPRGSLEQFTPRMTELDAEPDEAAGYRKWSQSRNTFLASPRSPEDWQKDYTRGTRPGETQPAARTHRTKLALKPFVKT